MSLLSATSLRLVVLMAVGWTLGGATATSKSDTDAHGGAELG